MMLMNRRHRHFNPASAGATLALDARDAARSYADGAAVTTWTGKAGSATGTVPTMDVDGLNGLPAVSFPGTADQCMVHSANLSGSVTWIVALQITGFIGGYKGIASTGTSDSTGSMLLAKASSSWGSYGGGASIDSSTDLVDGDKAILSMVDAGAGGGSFFRNGAANGTWAVNTDGQPDLHIGGSSGQGQDTPMRLGALILFPVATTVALRRRIEQSLAFSFRIACA
jgi:hypothetical protein